MEIQWGRTVTSFSQAEQAESLGFDFVQPTRDFLTDITDKHFQSPKDDIRRLGKIFKIWELPLPEDVQVTQQGFNIYAWMEYLKNALSRIAGLGCETLVWSDGWSRDLPVEGSTVRGKEQVLQFLNMLGGVAEEFGMFVLIEPLGPRRTNFLNTMKEAGALLRRVGRTNLASLISLRELEYIEFSFSELSEYQQLIRHVKLENPRFYEGKRVCPRSDDGYEYSEFLSALKETGYTGPICLPDDADEITLQYCRTIWGD